MHRGKLHWRSGIDDAGRVARGLRAQWRSRQAGFESCSFVHATFMAVCTPAAPGDWSGLAVGLDLPRCRCVGAQSSGQGTTNARSRGAGRGGAGRGGRGGGGTQGALRPRGGVRLLAEADAEDLDQGQWQ